MEYPQAIMRKAALRRMGFSEELLDLAYRDRRQTFAWKINPAKSNSPIEYDTAGFDRWLSEHKRIDRAALH